MSSITLRSYQTEALKKLLSIRNGLLCARVGSGKTLISLFLSRFMIKRNEIDKIIICVTPSSVGPFTNELSSVGIKVDLIDDVVDLIDFLKGSKRFVLIKHSFMEKLGVDKNNIDQVEDYLEKDYKKIMLIIDEAHKFSNHESIGNFAIDNTRRFYEKIVIMTATPYGSKLDQLYGLVKLIYPKQWKNLKDFKNNFVRVEIIKDWKTGKFLRTEDVEYINLGKLRKVLEQFTYFYFPSINLVYKEHRTKLKESNYKQYVDMCRSVFSSLKERVSKKEE